MEKLYISKYSKKMYITNYPMDTDVFWEIVGYDEYYIKEYLKQGYTLKKISEEDN